MVARIRTKARSQTERLKRLAVVFAIELRLKIVTQLYLQEMSPKQFFEKFGGGSLSRVSRNFDRLAETDWLRLTRSEGPGGPRRGGIEHFFRATELLYFDEETWALLPYSVRVAFSWNLFNQIADWLGKAVEAKAIEARSGSSLATQTLLLDRRGQQRVTEANDRLFASIFDEQDDARLRAARVGEELINASVLQLAYEAPSSAVKDGPGVGLVEVPQSLASLYVRASRVFPDELCMDIIAAANGRAISATQFHQEFGGNLGRIRRGFRKAAENGWLREVDWKTGGRRRGATEKFYRATRPAVVKAEEFLAGLSKTSRATAAGETFRQICLDFVKAMKAETVDLRSDRYVALSFLQLDREGWERIVSELGDLWTMVLEEQKKAKVRLEKSGEEPIVMKVAFGIYESPEDESKEP